MSATSLQNPVRRSALFKRRTLQFQFCWKEQTAVKELQQFQVTLVDVLASFCESTLPAFSASCVTTNMPKFGDLCKLTYKEQAIWFLVRLTCFVSFLWNIIVVVIFAYLCVSQNGFWGENGGLGNEDGNKVWDYVRKFVELDLMSTERKGEAGNELDQFWSAKFLEDMDSAIPALARKEALRAIDQDNNGKMACLEYLVWKYKKCKCDWTVNFLWHVWVFLILAKRPSIQIRYLHWFCCFKGFELWNFLHE